MAPVTPATVTPTPAVPAATTVTPEPQQPPPTDAAPPAVPAAATVTPPAKAEKQPHPEALGRSVGGHSTKVHAACESLGLPVRFLLSGGEVHDSQMAQALFDGLAADYFLADKGYDSRVLVASAEAAGMIVLVPSRSNSLAPRTYDVDIYRERNQIERMFNRLKNCRRVATRYEKTARNYLAMLQIAGTMLWLA